MSGVGDRRTGYLEVAVDEYYRMLGAVKGTPCHLYIARDYLAWGMINKEESSAENIEFEETFHVRFSPKNMFRAVSELFAVNDAIKVHTYLQKPSLSRILRSLEYIAQYNTTHGVLVRTIGRRPNEYFYEKDGMGYSQIDEEAACAVGITEQDKIPLSKLYAHFRPKRIIAELDAYVVGQEKAKRALARAAYWHLQRIHDIEVNGTTSMQSQSVLLLGPTGAGKTLLCEKLGQLLGLPFVKRDSTALTAAGYVGEDIEDYMREMWGVSGGDIKRLEYGLFLIDEIDKLASQSDNRSDVNGKGAQQRLLRFTEGTKIFMITDTQKAYPGPDYLDSSKNMKIFAGSFMGKGQPGIEEIIKKRMHPSTLGFGSKHVPPEDMLDHVNDEDLLHFGMMRELAARMTIKTFVYPQTLDELCIILTKPKESIIEQYKRAFAIDGHQLSVDDKALRAIATVAHRRGSNARSLRPIVDIVLGQIQEDLAGETPRDVCITEEDVRKVISGS